MVSFGFFNSTEFYGIKIDEMPHPKRRLRNDIHHENIPIYTERKKKRRVEFFLLILTIFTVFTIAIHFYRLSCECEPRVYESLVDVLSTQCVKSFNRALHSALYGQYGKPKFRAKQACLNLQHKISSHHLVHFNDTQRSSILLPIFLFIVTLL